MLQWISDWMLWYVKGKGRMWRSLRVLNSPILGFDSCPNMERSHIHYRVGMRKPLSRCWRWRNFAAKTHLTSMNPEMFCCLIKIHQVFQMSNDPNPSLECLFYTDRTIRLPDDMGMWMCHYKGPVSTNQSFSDPMAVPVNHRGEHWE